VFRVYDEVIPDILTHPNNTPVHVLSMDFLGVHPLQPLPASTAAAFVSAKNCVGSESAYGTDPHTPALNTDNLALTGPPAA